METQPTVVGKRREPVDSQPTVGGKDDCYHNFIFVNGAGWLCGKCGSDGNEPTVFKSGDCYHDYSFDDDVGWMCEKCGLVGQDIQNIYVKVSPSVCTVQLCNYLTNLSGA